MADLEVLRATETVYAAQSQDEEKRWVLDGQVSEMWIYTLSDHWNERIYSEYYTDFWTDILNDLERRGRPAEVALHVRYDFGLTTEEEVQQYLADHQEGSAFLVMHREADNRAQMSCVWLESYDIKELEQVG